MESTIYTYCAWAGCALIALQVVLQLFGVLEETDTDSVEGAPDDMGHEGAPDGHGNIFFGVLSFKALSAFIAFFGLTGLALGGTDVGTPVRILISGAAGFASMLGVAWLMRSMARLDHSGTVDFRTASGRVATVYLRIPERKSGRGKVTVEVSGRSMEVEAITEGEELPTGAQVRVVDIGKDGLAMVAAL